MINLGNLVSNIKQIDPIWAFSYYCKIPAEQFNGGTIKIKSIIQDEKTPSFCIYFKKKDGKDEKPIIKFKCFSSGCAGDFIDLVQAKFNLNYSNSCFKIMDDYKKWVISGGLLVKSEYDFNNKYHVSDYKKRLWNINDQKFWTPFNIGTKLLEWGRVKPLESYVFSNKNGDITIIKDYLYGYFTAADELYKIYQPFNDKQKFINVKEYKAGSEHGESNDFAIILSSWKEAMCVKSFDIKLDKYVPDSENTYFSESFIKEKKSKYKKIITLLDADDAGLKAMRYYKDKFNLDFVWLPLSKDISDSVRDYGKAKVRDIMIPLIHKVLN